MINLQQAKALVMERLNYVQLPDGQFFNDRHTKKQIVLHHTGGGSASSSIGGWVSDSAPVATPFIVDRDGTINQAYPSAYWAFSLGLTTSNFKQIEQACIPIELANYGYLKKDIATGRYINAYGNYVSNVCVLDKPWRGIKAFEAYTDAQIESSRRLLVYLSLKYNISVKYNSDIFDICQRALKGDPGLYTHASYRSDKTDISPQPKIIEMLKLLS